MPKIFVYFNEKGYLIIKFMIHMKRPFSPLGNRGSLCCNLITTLVCFIPSLFDQANDIFHNFDFSV